MNHSFSIEVAVQYGMAEAVLIENLRFWITKNAANGQHFYEGRFWTYNSARAYAELFPYLSEDKIQRTLKKLEQAGAVLTGSFHENRYDRTRWYSLCDELMPENCRAPFRKTAGSIAANCGDALRKTAGSSFRKTAGSSFRKTAESSIQTDITTDVTADVTLSPEPSASVAEIEVAAVTEAIEVAKVVEVLPAAKQPAAKPARPRKARTELDPADETELQAACRKTWAAYSTAYQTRYSVAPIRNAKVNAAVKGFVQRIGYDESPTVANFYVASVNDAFIVRQMHDVALLLKSAEGYRTQWATGRAVTATAAKQADQTAANYSAIDEAKAIVRARRAAREAGEDVL